MIINLLDFNFSIIEMHNLLKHKPSLLVKKKNFDKLSIQPLKLEVELAETPIQLKKPSPNNIDTQTKNKTNL